MLPYFLSFLKKICLLFSVALGLGCCPWAFTSCREQGLLSSCGVWASQGGGFAEQGSGHSRAQKLWLMGLVAPCHVGSSQTRD